MNGLKKDYIFKKAPSAIKTKHASDIFGRLVEAGKRLVLVIHRQEGGTTRILLDLQIRSIIYVISGISSF